MTKVTSHVQRSARRTISSYFLEHEERAVATRKQLSTTFSIAYPTLDAALDRLVASGVLEKHPLITDAFRTTESSERVRLARLRAALNARSTIEAIEARKKMRAEAQARWAADRAAAKAAREKRIADEKTARALERELRSKERAEDREAREAKARERAAAKIAADERRRAGRDNPPETRLTIVARANGKIGPVIVDPATLEPKPLVAALDPNDPWAKLKARANARPAYLGSDFRQDGRKMTARRA